MSEQGFMETHQTGRSVRLDTLVRLRWLAVIGQSTAVLVVYFGLDFELPIWACLAVIALAAWLNVALRIRFPMAQRLEPDRAGGLVDLHQLVNDDGGRGVCGHEVRHSAKPQMWQGAAREARASLDAAIGRRTFNHG